MARILSNTGIVTGQTVEALQVSQSIDAFTGAKSYDITVSGSFTVTGSAIFSGSTALVGISGNDSDNDGSVIVLDPSTNTLYTTGSYGGAGSGSPGPKGQKGEIGSKGQTGADSTTAGPTGPKGSFGPKGQKGAVGPSGNKGEKGQASTTAGPTGPKGQTGAGNTGPKGEKGTSGTTGSKGEKGTNGITGPKGIKGSDGNKGSKGEASSAVGPTGPKGQTGAGNTGPKGEKGQTGADSTEVGPKGAVGPTGPKGSDGNKGTKGEVGTTGPKGTKGAPSAVAGPKGEKGTTGAGTTGPKGSKGEEGSGGGGLTGAIYNNQITYIVSQSGTDHTLYVVSTGNLYAGLTWSRTSATLTVTSPAHGLLVGDYVVIRNMSEDYSYLMVRTVADINTFTLTVPTSGGSSGTTGAYIPALHASTVTGTSNVTAVILEAPSTGNVKLNMYSQFTSEQADPMTLTLPTGVTNGAGFGEKATMFIPTVSGITQDGTGAAGGFSPVLSFTLGASINTISISSIGEEIDSIFNLKF